MEQTTAETLSNIQATHATVAISSATWVAPNGEVTEGWDCEIQLNPANVARAEGHTAPHPGSTQAYSISAFGEDINAAVRRAAQSYFAARAASESEATT